MYKEFHIIIYLLIEVYCSTEVHCIGSGVPIGTPEVKKKLNIYFYF